MSAELPVVVVGGVAWDPGVNYPSVQTVRELARRRDVLYLYAEGRGTLGERLGRLAAETGDRGPRALRSAPLRRAGDRLWLAPIGGLFALLPLSSPEATRRLHVRGMARTVRRFLAERGAPACDLVVYWWFAPELVAAIPHAACVYDCVDEHADYPSSTVRAATVRRLEGALMDAVDRSFVVSPALVEPRAAPGRSITVLPNAFDTTRLDELRGAGRAPAAAPDQPVVGIVGGLGGRVDWELVAALVAARPAFDFVFLGGDAHRAPPAVAAAPNVRLLGVVPYAEALGVMAGFSVGVIPFASSAFTRGNSFLKLLDYLALGLPVVASPLPDTERVARGEPALLALADGREGWLAALDRAVAEPPDAPARALRRAYALQRSVERRVARLLESDGVNPAAAGRG